jgi:hypothetical protein
MRKQKTEADDACARICQSMYLKCKEDSATAVDRSRKGSNVMKVY